MVVYLAVLYDVNTTKAALYCDNWGALNENEIPETSTITLPASIREPILPTDARRPARTPGPAACSAGENYRKPSACD